MKENIIKALIDARSIEATRDKISLKLFTIAQYMGSPIISEYGYSSVLPDFWEYEENSEIAEADETANELNLGYSYDSLRYGINFEIIVRVYGDKLSSVRATMNGDIVYFEEEGLVQGYAPNTWNKHMEDLYVRAKILEDRVIKEQKQLDDKRMVETKRTLLQKLKLIWGYE